MILQNFQPLLMVRGMRFIEQSVYSHEQGNIWVEL